MRHLFLIVLIMLVSVPAMAQRFNLGLNFQFSMFRQIKIDADKVIGTYTNDFFYVKDNDWKLYSASYILGMEIQMDYKKMYAILGLYYNLNTYDYTLFYPVAPGVDEKVTFQHIYFQVDVPLMVGYQILSSGIFHYSIMAGIMPSIPYNISGNLKGSTPDNNYYDRYYRWDMRNILYDGKPFLSGVAGVGVKVGSLVKFDVRYQHQFGSPSDQYDVSFQTIGISLTFYLPLNLLKKKIYYEE